jgi:branched-chain amino acid transport system ATP-binding protein
MSDLLVIENLEAGYGPVKIVHDLNLSIPVNQRLALIGRNGVGKSTTLKALMGLADIYSGKIFFDGKDITKLMPHERASLGLGYVPQTRDIFPSLTVEENLIAGLKSRSREALSEAYELFPRLAERKNNGGKDLSGGEQQMLTVARALLGLPKLLLLDEPLEGLAPIIRIELLRAFKVMADKYNLTVVIVEQQVHEVLAHTEQVVVMDHGEIVHRDTSENLISNNQILERYIGMAIH